MDTKRWKLKLESCSLSKNRNLSIEKPSKLELKTSHNSLEYAFLRDFDTFLVIISSSLDT